MFDLFGLDSIISDINHEVKSGSVSISRLCEIYVFCDSILMLLNDSLSDEYFPWADLLQDIYNSVSDQIISYFLISHGYSKHLIANGIMYLHSV